MDLYRGETKTDPFALRGSADELTVKDFIATGTYSFAEKIRYIAAELYESGSYTVYDSEDYNRYLLEAADILNEAADKLDMANRSLAVKRKVLRREEE